MRMEHIFVLIHIRNKGEVVNVNMFKPFNIFTDYLNACSLLSFFYLCFMSVMVSCLIFATLWSPASK